MAMSIGPASAIKGASEDVLSAIRQASSRTGVDFSYLVNQARTESSFKADAKASTSSATGLYQFIDQTWLATVKQHGSKHGMGEYADAIQRDFQGRYFVADPDQKQVIMDLRKNPEKASMMAAEFAAGNEKYLEQKLGRDVTPTDLYFAHFLGAGGASKFLKAMDSDPHQAGANILKSAAHANKNIFYNSDGSKKSLNQIYKNFEAKFTGLKADQPVSNDVVETATVAEKTYRPDPQFSRFYTQPVGHFVSALPTMPTLKSDDFFGSMFTEMKGLRMQNQIVDPMSLLMLTQLDMPK